MLAFASKSYSLLVVQFSAMLGLMQLDTLTIAERLKEAGLDAPIAKEWAAIWHQSVTVGLASKEDISMLHAEIAKVRKEMALRTDMEVMRTDMGVMRNDIVKTLTIRFGGMMAAGIGILAALNYFS